MEDTKSEIRAAEDADAGQPDETRTEQASVVLTTRLLANPRRVRRT